MIYPKKLLESFLFYIQKLFNVLPKHIKEIKKWNNVKYTKWK